MRTGTHGHRQVDAGTTVAAHGAPAAAPPNGTSGFVRWLGDVSPSDAARVGVIGAALAARAHAGRPVPAGFVVTTDAYLRALDQLGGRAALRARIADVDIDDPPALTRAAKTCRALVRSADMPAAVRRSVLDAYTELAGDADHAAPVVVRASPTPDGPGSTSSAGTGVAFRDVRSGLELVDRIIECWASRWSPAVVADRAADAVSCEPAIAVVVARQ